MCTVADGGVVVQCFPLGMAAEALCWMSDIAQVLVFTLILIVFIVFTMPIIVSAVATASSGWPADSRVFVLGAHYFWV